MNDARRCQSCNQPLGSAHARGCERLIGEERGTVMLADCAPEIGEAEMNAVDNMGSVSDTETRKQRRFVDGQLVGREKPGERGIEYLGRVTSAHWDEAGKFWAYGLQLGRVAVAGLVPESKLIDWNDLPERHREEAKAKGWTTPPVSGLPSDAPQPPDPADFPEPVFHGAELDDALNRATTLVPEALGVCGTAMRSRMDHLISLSLKESTDPEIREEYRRDLMREGMPFDDATVEGLQIRSTVGGTLTFGLSTGLLLEREALAKKLLSREAIEAVAEAMWNAREYRDPSGETPDDWYPPGDNPEAEPPREPHLWAELIQSGKYLGDVREYRMDARRVLEALVELLEQPQGKADRLEISGRARGMADTAMLMELPELTPRRAQIALEVFGGHGQEVVDHGTAEQLEALTEVCPDCHGEVGGGGGNSDEPEWHCETCVGGRVAKRPEANGAAELIPLLREWADRDDGKRKSIPGVGGNYEHIDTLRRAADELERLSASPKGDTE